MKEIKNTWSVAFLSLIAVGSALQSTAVEAKDACKEPAPPAPCYSTADDSCKKYCLGPENYAASAPVFPKTCGGDIILAVDIMYARSELGGMAMAIHSPEAGAVSEIADEVLFPDFDYKLGGRVEIGYNATRDGWNFMGSWTRNYGQVSDSYNGARYAPLFQRSHRKAVGGAFAVGVAEKKSAALADQEIESVMLSRSTGASTDLGAFNAAWDMTTDIFDFSISRSQWLSKYVETAPRVGVRAGRVKQEWNFGAPTTVTLESTFKGVGAFFGFDTLWHLCGSFGLYSHVALGSWYGRFETDQKEKVDSTTFFTDFYTLRSFMENDFGLKWSAQFCEGSYGLFLSVGWETHIFYDQNPFYTVAPIYRPVEGSSKVVAFQDTTDSTVKKVLAFSDTDGNSALLAAPSEYVAPRRGDLATQGLVVKAHILF